MVQAEIPEADTPTIQLGATPSRLVSDLPPSSPPPIFTPDALPAAILPIYPGLGQAPNMLACMPSGLVYSNTQWLGLFQKRTFVIIGTGILQAQCPSYLPAKSVKVARETKH